MYIIYILVYIYKCVCVCVCVWLYTFLPNTDFLVLFPELQNQMYHPANFT